MEGDIVRLELRSADPERSAAFYAKLFAWRATAAASTKRSGFQTPGGLEGCWVTLDAVEAPGPIAYLAVADLDAALTTFETEGGRVLVRRIPGEDGVAPRAVCVDPDGNVIGLEEAARAPGAAPKAKAAAAAPKGKPSAGGAGAAPAKKKAGTAGKSKR